MAIGSGPASATTALLLARYGVDVPLVERETSFERVFRGEGLVSIHGERDLDWPRISCTTFGFSPCSSMSVAKVCLRL